MKKPTSEILRRAISAYRSKPKSSLESESPMHAVLHDDDLSDESVAWCRRNAEIEGDLEGIELADLLMWFSQEMREEALLPQWLKECN